MKQAEDKRLRLRSDEEDVRQEIQAEVPVRREAEIPEVVPPFQEDAPGIEQP